METLEEGVLYSCVAIPGACLRAQSEFRNSSPGIKEDGKIGLLKTLLVNGKAR